MSVAQHSTSALGTVVEDVDQGTFRVHRKVFTSQEIFEREKEVIFGTCWLYAAHVSEVSTGGSFVSRNVGGRPLIINRDKNDQLHVFFNSCMHRGATLCREKQGKARSFTCPYHGWVYADDGQLVHQHIAESYAPDCNKDGALHLGTVRFDVVAGFIFVNYDKNAMPLDDYLGDAKGYLELIHEQGEHGMEVIRGSQEYNARANWKLLQENSVDGYHAEHTHGTYLAYIKSREGTVRNNYGGAFGRVRDLKNGHAVSESVNGTPWGRPNARWVSSWGPDVQVEIDRIYARTVERLGEEKAQFICHGDRNMLIFPNLIINDVAGLTVRTVFPTAPDYFEVTSWGMGSVGESPLIRNLRLRNYVEFLGPGGLATPDDQEMLELCQRGYAAQPGPEWNDLSRGMLAEQHGEANKMDEFQLRVFWRHWHEKMNSPDATRSTIPHLRVEAA